MPKLAESLNPGGIILTSGFYYKEYEEVKKAGEAAGLRFEYARERDGWAIVRFKK